MSQDFQALENKITYFFSMFPETKNNDRLLMLKVWESEGLHLIEPQQKLFLHSVSSPELIRRLRQRIQQTAREQGNTAYLPSEAVAQEREKKEAWMRGLFATKPKEATPL